MSDYNPRISGSAHSSHHLLRKTATFVKRPRTYDTLGREFWCGEAEQRFAKRYIEVYGTSSMLQATAKHFVNKTVGVPCLLLGETVKVCIGELPSVGIRFQCPMLRNGLPVVLTNPA